MFSFNNNSLLERGTVEQAKEHAVKAIQRSKLVYNFSSISYDEINDLRRCQCCDAIAVMSKKEGTRFPRCCKIDDLIEIGRSYALFFQLCKVIMLTLALVSVACVLSMILNIFADPDQAISDSSFIIALTPGNLGKDPDSSDLLSQQIIHSISGVLLGIFSVKGFIYIKDKAFKYSLYKINAGDYTLMLDGLPKDFTNEEIHDFLAQIDPNLNIVVDSISRTYNINKVIEKSKEIFKLSKGLRKSASKVAPENEAMMNNLKFEKEELIKEAREMINPIVFVTLNDFLTTQKLLRHHKTKNTWLDWLRFKLKDPNFKNVFRGTHLVSIQPTPHPTDVIWENLSTTSNQRARSKIITYFCSFLLLLVVAGIILYIKEGERLLDSESLTGLIVKSVLAPLVIIAVNLLFEWFLEIVTKYEKYLNSTDKTTSLTSKFICLLLINTAFIPLVVNALHSNGLFTHNGLVNDIAIIISLNALMPPMTYYYNIRFAWRWIRQKLIERKFRKDSEYSIIQGELNKIYKPLKINISERYARILSIMHVSLFFSSVLPVAVPIGLLGIVLEYWCTKTMLLRYHSAPKALNEALGVEMGLLVKLSVASYITGNICFYSWIGGESILVVLDIIILSLYLLVPFSAMIYHPQLSRQINKKYKRSIKETKFWKFKLFLQTDFERANPMTRAEAIEQIKRDRREFKNNPDANIERPTHSTDIIEMTAVKSIDEYISKKFKILQDKKFSRNFYNLFIRTEECRDNLPEYAKRFSNFVNREAQKHNFKRYHLLSTYALLEIIEKTPAFLLEEDLSRLY